MKPHARRAPRPVEDRPTMNGTGRSVRPTKARRGGATTVETAFVASAVLVVMIATLDLGLAVLRYNTLSAIARGISRAAIVRGERSSSPWGPATLTGTLDAGAAPAVAAADLVVALDSASVAYTIEWLDGGNAIDDRVRVHVASNYVPVLPFLLGTGPYELTATSILRVMY